MATGDLKGSLRKLEQGLRLLNYPRDVDYTGSSLKGDPAAFLPIISYSFTSFSTYIAELLVESDVELTAKSDLRFIEAIYKAKSQTRKKTRSLKSESQANCEKLLADPVICRTVISQQKPQVERHPDSEVNVHGYNTAIPVDEDSEEESCVADDVLEVVREQATEDNSQIELLKSQLAECQEKLHKLNWMEDKLHVLEEKLKGKVIIDEKDWNNLLSRVLLLETELLLQSKKSDLSTEFNNMSEDHTSSRNMTPISPDIERKEEMPESLHQSSGYSSLLSTDPSPKAATINYHGLTEISKETTRQRMERISKIAGLRTMVYILLETLQLGLEYCTQETFIHTILPSVLFNKT
ncbi:centrosomal protein of 44 kDa isoform X4 [Gopherus evgoodei]|uniref:centrosomal protein of 44 kDa isoform X4 n=1 Tax=Gopherus evgoodei TaxID=1825980 RepID=UPI0011CF5100|nr:centrosomal protein of 44 kDa isoform X4 [Gopherus evgoodei]